MMILQIGLVARLIGVGEASNDKFHSFTLIKAKTFWNLKIFLMRTNFQGWITLILLPMRIKQNKKIDFFSGSAE